ncbi:hypothetical protein Pmar_PMAR006526 [Perkinsus marinus ATCC 50983]|uniref:Uncharacterized protein n=1 Tax=Perkinsus marinus (strain ATCC 50983 / TXsc) TaxID=423536 RepID=C5LTP2_PERM5|nr:hypothetical protein Pmar_PMAR006526 [Perkinsus marinus ATCC 50983]EEQ99854.1 hypothetical protein Pmar_PMAR006526 [Perkinsus marinus ATCC 50983]|eukprot:XP_002767137.1 hypothetical protein Pmar_PMAR006526 [Perkinsus marinus ATCC 50983]
MWDMGHNGSEGPLGRELARFYGVYFGFYAGSGILCLLLGILLLQLPHHMGLGEYKGLTFWALGMLEAYGYVDFVMYISAPRIGPRSTSLVTGFALLVDGCIALMYGYLVYRGVCRLRTVPSH